MPSAEIPEPRQGYRRGSDREIRALDGELQRQADMLIRHERELREIREAAAVNKTLLIGSEGQGGLLNEVHGLKDSVSHLDDTIAERLDRARTWAIGSVIAFATGSLGVIVAIAVTSH